MTNTVKQAEADYDESKEPTRKALEKMKKETMGQLDTMLDTAIDRFMDETAAAIYKCFCESMDIIPFLASVAGVAANFHSITFSLTIQTTEMPFDIEMGRAKTQLDPFTTLAHMVPSLCPLSTPNTIPRPDLVGFEEVPAIESKQTEKEKAVTSTSSDGTLRVSKPPHFLRPQQVSYSSTFP